jgi:hypothetical protein
MLWEGCSHWLGGAGPCDGQVTGTIQFTISSDPVSSEVVPEVEGLEIDSNKKSAGLTASDWPEGLRF